MAAQQLQQLEDLEQSFQIFNLVSSRLEATYQLLDNHVAELHHSLAESHPKPQRLQTILKALPAGVVVLDGKGRVLECNPAATSLLGEPLLGEVWTDVISRAFAPRSDDGHDISLASGRRVSIDTCPLGDEPGQVLLFTDVTETRELQDRLSQHQRLSALGEMAAGLAHQVRTPLASGLLYASQLKRSNLDDTTRSELSQKVVTQLRQLDALINDMLLFSRSGYGGEEIIAADELLNALAKATKPHCAERGIELQIRNTAAGRFIKGNSHTLLSALQNLSNNALQAMNNVGTLTLSVRAGACDMLEIAVADTGPGIPRELQDKLFKPFFTTRSSGTGLGLSVVKAVTQANGGSVHVESSPGKGSEFVLQLPELAMDDVACHHS